MREHEPRVEVEVHGQRAERRLQQRPEEDDEGEPAELRREKPRRECDEDREERDHAVRELDVAVVALRLEVMLRAAGPVLAAEAGAGQTHRRAGRHDQHEHRGVRQGEPAEGRGRQREGAHAGERLGAGFHLARTVAAPGPVNLTLT